MTKDNLRQEAVAWFEMTLSGEMTAEDRDEFNAWLISTPEAGWAYRRLERDWAVAGSLRDDKEVAASRERDLRHYALVRSRKGALRPLSAMAAALVLAIAPGWLAYRHFFSTAYLETVATGPSRHITTTLSDGTVVTLDANSELRVIEMGARRRVELASGHAFFHVAKDPRHPFLVAASDKTVRALGTAFDVRILGSTVAVTLVEGKVRVNQAKSLFHGPVTTDMVPGRQLFATADRAWTMSRVNTADATEWIGDQMVYLPDTLGRIIADINETSPRKIVLRGNYDPDRKVVGVFRKGDVDAVVDALELNGIGRVTNRSGTRIEMEAGLDLISAEATVPK